MNKTFTKFCATYFKVSIWVGILMCCFNNLYALETSEPFSILDSPVNATYNNGDIDVLLASDMDCNTDVLCVPIQLKAGAGSFEIGTSSIFLNYNASAITFKSYTSSAFDGSDLCIANAANAWTPHAFDGNSVPGSFNLTMTLNSNDFSCPSIGTTPIEVGTICFNVINNNRDPNITINSTNTNFNSAATNNGTSPINKSTLGEIRGTAVFDCLPVGCNDADNDGTCDTDDCQPNNPSFPAAVGTFCDDGNANTTNDIVQSDGCSCQGTPVTNNGAGIDILLASDIDCNTDVLCVPISLKASTGSFEMGTSSIFLTYNTSALAYRGYTSSTFDGTDLCIANAASAWTPHAFDGNSVPGSFNLTMTLNSNDFSCPAISTAPIEVGIVCFDVIDNNSNPNISVNFNNTNFNSAITNNGTNPINKNNLGTISGTAVLDCTTSSPCASQGGDTDGDGICDNQDNCAFNFNPDQADNDGDGIGNVCDDTPNGAPCANQGGDTDGDGICDNQDNCAFNFNPDQADNDGDGIGNVCDDTPNGAPCANQGGDTDGDGICDNQDNCAFNFNPDQADNDGDGIGNVCDDTPNGNGNSGGGNTCNEVTATGGNGVVTVNNLPAGARVDISGAGTDWALQLVCEGNCASTESVSNLTAGEYTVKVQTFNPYCYKEIVVQVTSGNAGNPCASQGGDTDGDGICDNQDNCAFNFNPDQADNDGDGIGNVCDDTPNGSGNQGGSTCNEVTATGGNGVATINNLPIGAKAEILGASTGWALQLICEGNCTSTASANNLTAGEYTIKVQTFNPYCYKEIVVEVTNGNTSNSCANQGGDTDGDGICNNQDNCDFNFNPDQADNDGDGIGNVCDDTPNGGDNQGGSTCNEVTAIGGNGIATINGLSLGAKVEILGVATGWALQLVCEGNCASTESVNNLTAGEYTIKVQTFNPYCYKEIVVEVTDNNSNNATGGLTCNDVVAIATNEGITLYNVPTDATIDFTGEPIGWALKPICAGDCAATEIINNLSPGFYILKVQTYNPYCYREINLNVPGNGASGRSTPQATLDDFEIYPNPTDHYINLELETIYSGRPASISIRNVLGKSLHEEKIDALPDNAIYIPLVEYPAGTYMLTVKIEGVRQKTKMFLVSRL